MFTTKRIFRTLLLSAALALSAASRAAPVDIDEPWTRATAPGQKVAGAFMGLTAHKDMRLVGGATPAAETVELHFMRMQDGRMEMRALDAIDLPAGVRVDLAPGGFHAMLIGLKKQIRGGDRVPLTLTFKDAGGKTEQIEVMLEAFAPR